jgi:Mn2+/Fe2+ NRAMP family transporter
VFAQVSELSGVAAVGELWGLSRAASVGAATALLLLTVGALPYRRVETLGVALGAFEGVFIVAMCLSPVDGRELAAGLATVHADEPSYLRLVAANVGAVIMPWMIYFQQSAVVANGLAPGRDEAVERAGTLLGAGLTQLVMVGAMVTMAATRRALAPAADVTIDDLVGALAMIVGPLPAQLMLSAGFVGGALCASLTVGLAVSWGVCEAAGAPSVHALETPSLRRAPLFYAAYAGALLVAAAVLLSGADVVQLNILVESVDALLMPLTLAFLVALASRPELPDGVRVQGAHYWLCVTLFTLVAAVAWLSFAWGLVEDGDDAMAGMPANGSDPGMSMPGMSMPGHHHG